MIGFLNINKPAGITSHDVVSRIRKIVGVKQVGHGGTLDPFAVGILPIAIGSACRLLRFISGDKTYLAQIQLGLTTDTDDITGKELSLNHNPVSTIAIRDALMNFVGTQEQVPPNYSARHHGGKRLYELARQGLAPENVSTKSVTIQAIEITSLKDNLVECRIACSAGTYIRSIARDLGAKLKCGGCLKSLIREKAGPFELAQAISLDQLEKVSAQGQLVDFLIAPYTVLSLPHFLTTPEEATHLAHGRSVVLPHHNWEHESSQHLVAVNQGTLLAICRHDGKRIYPEVVLV